MAEASFDVLWAELHFLENVRVRLETLTLEGRFLDLDQDGALVIETGGDRRRIAAGEVFPALG